MLGDKLKTLLPCLHRLGLEKELRSEKEQRQSLQKALQREQDNSMELRTQLQQLQGLNTVSVKQEPQQKGFQLQLDSFKSHIHRQMNALLHLIIQELHELKQEKQQLQQTCEQQEQALQEMGLHLSQSVAFHF